MKTRRQHSAEFKARVALEAIKAERTLNEIAADYEVNSARINDVLKERTHIGSKRVAESKRSA